ncbi:MAG: family 78 glycoside hydrolase catalytic domain, partial [Tannerellaceae bacterium]|nr:family 78 glycoside hydrolase catalytic domain [Tannerellaceae bacterium]
VTHFSTFASGQPENLRCEYLENPLGIGIRKPRFNWIITSSVPNIRQTAYELLVSEQKEELEENRGSQWYSGKIKEEGSIQVIYKGNPLKPFTRYFWKVRIFDEHDIPSSWSEIQWFETAMLSPEDWEAQWIGNGQPQFQNDEEFYQEDPMPLFRKEFTIQKQIRSARLYICGLGYHEAYLNGEKIGDHVLDPGWTAHKKQNLYVTHDITGLIRKGKNTTGIMLGNGWYNPLPLQLFARFNIRDHQQTGRPVVKAQIHLNYMDGSTEIIQTDNSWFTTQGPVIKNNVYLGEHYDGRWEVPDWNKNKVSLSGWRAAVIEKGPDGELSPQIQPAVKIQEIIRPVHIWKTRDNTFIVDMGINFAGVARIKVKGRSGTKITLRYGENIHPDSTLNWLTTTAGHIKSMWGMKGGPGAPEDAYQEDSYILHGNGRETYMPRFTFHGFRYVEIIGWPGTPTKEEIEGIRMYADLETNGTFTCSNELFNQLHEITQRTFLSNVFSVQSDCPGREKMGYGGDMVVTGESYLYNYNMANFYRKTIRDFINDQTPEGGMTGIAPYTGIADRGIGGESGSLGWQLAFPYLQKKLYEFYGDKQTIEISYPAFVKQMEFIQRQTIGELFHWDIGDHVAIDPRAEAFSACAFYYEHARLITEFAAILGKKRRPGKISTVNRTDQE